MPEKKMYCISQHPGRIVTGPFGDVGYIVKPPDAGKTTEAIQEQRYKARQMEADDMKMLASLARLEPFYRSCNKMELRSIRAAANRFVNLGMKQAEEELNWRRNKLKTLLLNDESKHTEEYTAKAQNALEVRHEREKNKAEEIMQQKTDTDAILGRKIIERENLLNSKEFKDKLRSENVKTLHKALDRQIYEQEIIKLENEETEETWNAMAAETDRKDLETIERNEEKKRANQHAYLEALQKQIEEKKKQRANEACVEKIEQKMIDEIVQRNNRQYDLRMSEAKHRQFLHDQCLLRQIKENRLTASRMKEEEMRIDRTLIEYDMRKKAAEEAAIRDNRRQAWSELVIFKESINQYRNALLQEESKFQLATEKLGNELEAERGLEQKRRETAHKLLNKEAAEHAKKMAVEKIARAAKQKAHEEKLGALERYRCAQQDQLDAACLHWPLKEVDTIPYLDKQVEYSRVLEQRHLQEDREMLERQKANETLHQRLLKDQTVAVDFATQLHPFYRVLRNPR